MATSAGIFLCVQQEIHFLHDLPTTGVAPADPAADAANEFVIKGVGSGSNLLHGDGPVAIGADERINQFGIICCLCCGGNA